MIHLAAILWDPIQLELSAAKETPSKLASLAAYAWPIITLFALILYRTAISKFLETIGLRAKEIGIGWASIKLPEVSEAPAGPVNVIRELNSSFWHESGSQWFQSFLSSSGSSEYALLDIGDGDQWITSRLYIFAVILQRMKALKCIVFTKTLATGDRDFLGCITPENLRWAMAANQPWLESAFAQAYSLYVGVNPFGHSYFRIDSSIDPAIAEQIVTNFIVSLKEAPGLPDHAVNPDQWVQIHSGWEHATWVNESELNRLLGAYLWKDTVEARTDDTADQKKLEAKRVVNKSAPYVAILNKGSYKALVSRMALLSEIAQSMS